MILVDTSIWIDHFRAAEPQLVSLLTQNRVLTHSCIIGEIALGSIAKRDDVLRYLRNLAQAVVASHVEVMTLIDRHRLMNSGIGYVDACLLASAALTPDAALWTRDKAVRAAAARCGVAPKPTLR